MRSSMILLLVFATACSGPKFLHQSEHDGVKVAYRWDHKKDKPSELIMRMENATMEDRRISLVIDLYVHGKTVETLQADTCIRVAQTLNGKLNGIFFVPEQVTTEQIERGEVQVDMTKTFVEPLPCK